MERATERDLVAELKAAREQVEIISEQLEQAKKLETKAESALIELLEANGATSTADYDGLGRFTRTKDRLYANVTKENQDKLFSFLAEIGRTDLIKESVAPQTLSTFVRERIENGDKLPDFIGYYFKASLRFVK